MEPYQIEVDTQVTCPLPAGYTSRPANLADVDAAAALFNTCSQDLMGVSDTNVDLLRSEWQLPTFHLETNTRLVFNEQGQLAGYYELWETGAPHVMSIAWGRIHPEHTGRGLGTALLAWAEARARENIAKAPPGARVNLRGWILSKHTAAEELLQNNGFQLIRHSLRMVIGLNGAPPAAQIPEGITIRTFQGEHELRPVVQTIRDAFCDHWGYVEHPFEEEYERTLHFIREDKLFDRQLWFLAEAEGQIVGTSLCRPHLTEDPHMGWVGTLGVVRDWRKKGLGLALLEHSFSAFYERGVRKVGLGVDAESLTGATRLYEKAGMRSDPNRQFSTFEKVLRPGVDLSTTRLE